MNPGRGGVEYDDLKFGDGPCAERGRTVEVRYDLYLNHGERVQENQVCSFWLGERRVVAGLEYGVEGMRAGGVRHIRAGAHLCYRDRGVPGLIPPNAVLEFHVTMLSVQPDADTEGTVDESPKP